MAYTAAADQCLEDPLPVGMGIQVVRPDPARCFAPVHRGQVITPNSLSHVPPVPGPDGLCDFDELGLLEVGDHQCILIYIMLTWLVKKRAAIAELINHLPPVESISI